MSRLEDEVQEKNTVSCYYIKGLIQKQAITRSCKNLSLYL